MRQVINLDDQFSVHLSRVADFFPLGHRIPCCVDQCERIQFAILVFSRLLRAIYVRIRVLVFNAHTFAHTCET